MMRRSLARGVLVGATILVVAGRARAWAPIDPSEPTWRSVPVEYKVNQSTIPASIGSIGVARIDAGFAIWASPMCTDWRAENGGDTDATADYGDGVNSISWRSGSWPPELGDVSSIIGVTLPVWGNDGAISDADITLNDVGFQWDDAGLGDDVDTQSIATHEEGHFLGLGHSMIAGATMYPKYAGGTSLRTIEPDDVSGVCTLYPWMPEVSPTNAITSVATASASVGPSAESGATGGSGPSPGSAPRGVGGAGASPNVMRGDTGEGGGCALGEGDRGRGAAFALAWIAAIALVRRRGAIGR